jgi:hypothetical protein
MLTGACAIAIIRLAYARNRRFGWGLALLLAAAMPLFVPLYLVGLAILRYLGAGVAGGLLIGAGLALALATLLHTIVADRTGATLRSWKALVPETVTALRLASRSEGDRGRIQSK